MFEGLSTLTEFTTVWGSLYVDIALISVGSLLCLCFFRTQQIKWHSGLQEGWVHLKMFFRQWLLPPTWAQLPGFPSSEYDGSFTCTESHWNIHFRPPASLLLLLLLSCCSEQKLCSSLCHGRWKMFPLTLWFPNVVILFWSVIYVSNS